MKKIKKYVYPFAFSAFFLILYISFALLLVHVISFPHGSYAPAAWAVLLTLAWIIFALPIYCIRYSKIIVGEKFKFLFAVYNCLVLGVIHILPFDLQGEEHIVIIFFVWVVLWTALPLIFRLDFRKNIENTTEDEPQI